MVALGEVGTDFFMDVGISGDGSTIFGECSPEGFRWTQASGLQIFPGFSAWFHPTSSTYDGETLAGFLSISGDSVGAVTWTAATGTTLLPVLTGLASIAWDLTPDGAIIAGELTGDTGRRTTRWRDDQTSGAPYCDPAVANSASATGAYLSLGGSNRAAEGTLILNVSDLPPNSFGFFLVSRVRDLVAMPGGSQGTLCLGSAIGRFVGPGQIMQSGPEGTFSLTVDPTTIPSPSGPVLPSFGETWHFQAWYRDANPGVTSNFSSAGSVPIY